ncbi:hypothetical protein PFISCL1PPCAC_7120, partial [Pristionchus fissidentatus]
VHRKLHWFLLFEMHLVNQWPAGSRWSMVFLCGGRNVLSGLSQKRVLVAHIAATQTIVDETVEGGSAEPPSHRGNHQRTRVQSYT